MTQLTGSLQQLYAGQDLSEAQAQHFFSEVVQGKVDPILLSAFLTALKIKGETPTEISGAATALREQAVSFPQCTDLSASQVASGHYADNCGTGGDGCNTFNISTTASIVAASCGLPIVKHGNRSVSSKSGSADMLESFGVNLLMTPNTAHHCLDQSNLTFLFAPHYHAGIRHAMPVRKALNTRTVFNILGPLVNPARPSIQLLGVYSAALCLPIAQALSLLGVKRAMVVHGSGMDEIALHGETTIVEVNQGKISEYTVTPSDFGIKSYPISSLAGGEPSDNAKITTQILKGQGSAAHNAAVAMNVSALLVLFEQATDFKQGMDIAQQALATGQAQATLNSFIALSNQ